MIDFKLNVSEKDLENVNINSLLFDSDEEIASLQIGKYYLSLMVRGSVRINYKGEIFKSACQYTEELKNAIKNTDWYENEDLDIIDNNWFQFELLKEIDNDIAKYNYVNEVNDYLDIADIEGSLESDKYSMKEMLYNEMVEYLKFLKDNWENELQDLDLSELLQKEVK